MFGDRAINEAELNAGPEPPIWSESHGELIGGGPVSIVVLSQTTRLKTDFNQDASGTPLTMSKLATCCISIWLVLGSLAGLLLAQDYSNSLHPVVIPFLLLLAAALVIVILTLVLVAQRLIRGEGRRSALLWLTASAIPVALFVSPFVYGYKQYSERRVPTGIRGKLAVMAGGTLMEAEAAYFYPNRAQSERLVMFYHDLADPHGDMAEMDRHVSELEELLGRPLRSKIHWIRGSLLGKRNLSFLALALGSTESPSRKLDRHELAHAVLRQFRTPSADPPMLLHEGWAESQSGLDSAALARRGLTARDHNPTTRIVDLLAPDKYWLDAGLAYPYGGGFVDFLLRNYSVSQFVEIQNRCDVSTFESDFRAVYGKSLTELEDAFWRDATAIASEGIDGPNSKATAQAHDE